MVSSPEEDREWLTQLVMLTEKELPAPKPKKKGKKQATT